jgi:hypothetical protein
MYLYKKLTKHVQQQRKISWAAMHVMKSNINKIISTARHEIN